jgi:hypothetical protein
VFALTILDRSSYLHLKVVHTAMPTQFVVVEMGKKDITFSLWLALNWNLPPSLPPE